MGTAGYMSPEQVRGMALDPRSDIFSFGAILYEMLSGKRAFHGDTARRHDELDPEGRSSGAYETNRNVSPALERIVHHCLEKNPESRFHSASDIAFDLEHLSGLSGSTARVAAGGQRKKGDQTPQAAARDSRLDLRSRAWCTALGWWTGKAAASMRARPSISRSRFAPVPSATRGLRRTAALFTAHRGRAATRQLYMSRTDDPGARELGIKDAELLSISKSGEWRFGSTRSVTAAMRAAERWREFR
jgi:hypothetical protein